MSRLEARGFGSEWFAAAARAASIDARSPSSSWKSAGVNRAQAEGFLLEALALHDALADQVSVLVMQMDCPRQWSFLADQEEGCAAVDESALKIPWELSNCQTATVRTGVPIPLPAARCARGA